MLSNWVSNCVSTCILSISILGDEIGIPSSIIEGQNDTLSMYLRALDRPSWGLSQKFQFIFSKCLSTTSKTGCLSLDGPSWTTIMVVRDPTPMAFKIFSKCQTMDLYYGPSCSRLSVLHNHRDYQYISFWESNIFSKVFHDGPSSRSIMLTTNRHHGPSCSQ